MVSRRFFWMGVGLGLCLVSFFLPAFVDGNSPRLGYETCLASLELLSLLFLTISSPELDFSSVGEALLLSYLGSLWLANLAAPLSHLAVRQATWVRSLLLLCSLLPLGVFFTLLRDGLLVGFYVWAASLLILTGAALFSPRVSLAKTTAS